MTHQHEQDGRLAVSIEQARAGMIDAHERMAKARRALDLLTYEIGQATIDVVTTDVDVDTASFAVGQYLQSAVQHRQQLSDAEQDFWASYVIYSGGSSN